MADLIADPASELERLRRERDLYRDLLELGRRDDIEPFLEGALDLLVRLSGAKRGYIELFEDRDDADAPRFLVAKGCYDEQVEEVRAAMSKGIMAQAITTGRTIILESAQLDPEIRKLKSVRMNKTQAVLCAPIGSSPPVGVVYLQDREAPAPFSEDDRRIVEDFAGHLAMLATRLLVSEHRFEGEDPTAPFRAKLHGGAARVVGRSRELARVLEQIARVAPRRNMGVLLGGPTGTGKTELAKLLHDSSPRAGGPFVAMNCAHLTDERADLSLFGVEGRVFTSVDARPGCIETAEGGTLFLDEIGDLPIGSQAKLLTFLDSKEYARIGSTKIRRADIRIVSATHHDLRGMVEDKTFRADLYYRLCVVQAAVPSLADRRADIPLIAEHFCDRIAEEEDVPRPTISAEAMRALQKADWPGNIRHLYKCIQAAMIQADEGDGAAVIEPRHLAFDAPDSPSLDGGETMQAAGRRLKKQQVEKALADTGGNVTQAAIRLGIGRSWIYELMSEFGIERKKA